MIPNSNSILAILKTYHLRNPETRNPYSRCPPPIFHTCEVKVDQRCPGSSWGAFQVHLQMVLFSTLRLLSH